MNRTVLRLLNKFVIGSFVHNTKKGLIGLVLKSSTEEELHIGWFHGQKQIVKLNPGSAKEHKLLQRAMRYKALQIEDFALSVGLPTRILKIVKSEGLATVNTESIMVPERQLDELELINRVCEIVDIDNPEHTELSSKTHGNTLRTLVKIWD